MGSNPVCHSCALELVILGETGPKLTVDVKLLCIKASTTCINV